MKTRYKELEYRKDGPTLWRICETPSSEASSAIGPHYRTKAELLADLERFAAEFGCEDAQKVPTMTNSESPTNLRGIQAKYYGPTNCKGSRIRITDLRGIIEKPLWIPYNYALNSVSDMAQHYLEARGWVFEFTTEHPEADILLTRDFRVETWEGFRKLYRGEAGFVEETEEAKA